MATVSTIVTALGVALDKLTWIDAVSTTEFLPAVTVSCAAIIVPFGQETTAGADDLSGATAVLTHRITVEFWVKHVQGAAGTTMQVARDAGTKAIAQLLIDDGIGYVIARDMPFTETVEPAFVTHANVPWLIASLTIPVENEVTT